MEARTFRLRNLAMDALVELIDELQGAGVAGAREADLAAARDFQRQAQLDLDFIEVEHSMGFHAPPEAARILAESINCSRRGQVALRAPPQASP